MRLVCVFCKKEFETKRRKQYCSRECSIRSHRIKHGKCQSYEVKEKKCVVCGNLFSSYFSRRVTCSDECAKIRRNHRPYSAEEERARYLKINPNARTRAEIMQEAKLKRIAKEEEKKKQIAEQEKERAKEVAIKEKEKQERIEYWQHYSAEHVCTVCGCFFTAKYPTTKYCSDRCRKQRYKTKRRYKNITIDNDITLEGLALRDDQTCQLCGCAVDWSDKKYVDGTVICGDSYPSVDHIIPISLGGMHAWSNVQLAHRICNTKKSNKIVS